MAKKTTDRYTTITDDTKVTVTAKAKEMFTEGTYRAEFVKICTKNKTAGKIIAAAEKLEMERKEAIRYLRTLRKLGAINY